MTGRVVYIGDHQVTFSFGGHAFLAKLLEAADGWDRVAVECGWEETVVQERLPGIDYRRVRFSLDRLQGTRFVKWHAGWVQASLGMRARRLRRAVNLRHEDLVVTIAHDFAWLPALQAARLAGATSAVFVHDEWVRLFGDRLGGNEQGAAIFREALTKATRVFAVSEGMQDRLRDCYGIESEVFLPPRRRGLQKPARKAKSPGRPFRFAYCGQLWREYWHSLRVVAQVGRNHGWEVHIFTNEAGRRVAGVEYANVQVHEFLPEERLVSHLAAEADALVVALDFSADASETMETMFSSKLAEYTATGLPVVIMAPPHAHMARWARAQGCFLVIDRVDPEYVERELCALAGDPTRCRCLGEAAAELVESLFAPERAVEQLMKGSGVQQLAGDSRQATA
jgi:glycosyltransferase involved in cell wall biosynthesis